MDQATRTKKHAQRWSAGETSVRRIGIGGVLFAVIVLLTVIEPYHIESTARRQLVEQNTRLDEIKAELDEIDRVQEKLDEAAQQLATEPWSGRIEALKKSFSAGEISNAQSQSDATLRGIGNDLQSDLISPLRDATRRLGSDNPLVEVPGQLNNSVDSWLNYYQDTPWWISRDSKDDTAAAIGEELHAIVNNAAAALPEIRQELETQEESNRNQLKEVEDDIAQLKANLQSVIDRALPGWARGIIGVDHLLVLYPWLLAGIAVYFVATALSASHHFRAMADGEGWSREERRDPLYSSAWTLTPRGMPGSIATFVTYGAVLAVLGACLYRSQHPPTSAAKGSVQASVDVLAAQSGISVLVAYALLAASAAIVAMTVFRDRHAPEDG